METERATTNEVLTLDLDKCFDIILVAHRHNKEADTSERVEVSVVKQQPEDDSLRCIKLSGTLIEAGLGDIFWEKVDEFEAARLQRTSEK